MKRKTSSNPSGKPPKARVEKDIDDLVHSTQEEIPKELGEADPDDLVHQPVKKVTGNVDESLADPDDLVHDTDEIDPDQR